MYELYDSMNNYCRLHCTVVLHNVWDTVESQTYSKHLSQSSKATWSGRRLSTASSTCGGHSARRCHFFWRQKSPVWRLHQGRGVLRQGLRWLPGWVSVKDWGNAQILPRYSKFVDVTMWLDLQQHWNNTFVPTIPPSLKHKEMKDEISERWLRSHVVTSSGTCNGRQRVLLLNQENL